jgi:hypothetical protein
VTDVVRFCALSGAEVGRAMRMQNVTVLPPAACSACGASGVVGTSTLRAVPFATITGADALEKSASLHEDPDGTTRTA